MTTMTDSKAADVLAAHNEWRRGGDGPQTEPVTLGLALERAIARLREPAGVGGEWVLVPREPSAGMWDSAENAMIESECAYNAGEQAARSDAHGFPTMRIWQAVVGYRAMLAAAPQPPADAQAQGGGEVESWQKVVLCPECRGAGGRRWHEADGSERGERCGTCDGFGHVNAPPSAPVGVEAADDGIGEYHIDGVHFDIPGQWTRVALRRAAAQGGGFRLDASGRPVSVDAPVRVEDLMTVYATAFNRCSLDPDDRFSPAFRGIEAVMRALAQQPAAVSALQVFRIAGGDTECEPNPTAERALEVLRDLRACYDEALKQQPAAVDGACGDACAHIAIERDMLKASTERLAEALRRIAAMKWSEGDELRDAITAAREALEQENDDA